MKPVVLSLVAASALIGVTVMQSRGESPVVGKPGTVSAIRSAALLDRGTKAVTAYVNACADGDHSRLQAVLAEDAAIELPLAEPGTFFLVDAAGAPEFCNANGSSQHVRSLRIYPAGEHSMFASFGQGGDKQQLLLIEMRGSRILRLRDFTADSEQVRRFAAGQQRTKSKETS